MTQDLTPDASVSRRHWIALAIAALTGCGGGAGSAADGDATGAWSGGEAAATDASGLMVAEPGTGGTGISVLGAISGFGSVVINGVHYDDRGAWITLDGASADNSALRLGMVAGINGTRSADGQTGVAQSIDVWSIAQGVVTSAAGDRFTVMGMGIALRSSTFVAAAPAVGQAVVVWGFQADAEGRQWAATRVDAAAGRRAVVTGMVVRSGDERSINGLRLGGDLASGLGGGAMYRVAGAWDGETQTLDVAAARRIDIRGDTRAGQVVEIEGVVSAPLSGGFFSIGSVRVDASGVAAAAAALRVGQEIEVYGHWQDQVLVATKVEVEEHG